MHRKHLPSAIRGTLNNTAFDVKDNTMLKSSKKEFVNRNKNFFRATSRVKKAKGFNIKTMQSVVGFLGGEKNQAVRDLEQQELGGSIKGRSFIPMKDARTSKSNAKQVSRKNRLSNIKNVQDSINVRGKNRAERFIKASIKAGVKGHVIGNYPKRILYEIQSIKRVKGNTLVKTKKLYSYEKGRGVTVKRTGFMKKASLNSAKGMNKDFRKEAKRQIEIAKL